MAHFVDLFYNNYIWSAILGALVAQLFKFIMAIIKHKRYDFKLFVSSGGMPSSHSAFVMGITGAVGFEKGWDAPLTAVALIFSLMVMYDAAGVRRAAGKQAEILNKLVFESKQNRELKEKRLKELIGHTPVEVLSGAVLGLVMAYIVGNL